MTLFSRKISHCMIYLRCVCERRRTTVWTWELFTVLSSERERKTPAKFWVIHQKSNPCRSLLREKRFEGFHSRFSLKIKVNEVSEREDQMKIREDDVSLFFSQQITKIIWSSSEPLLREKLKLVSRLFYSHETQEVVSQAKPPSNLICCFFLNWTVPSSWRESVVGCKTSGAWKFRSKSSSSPFSIKEMFISLSLFWK